MQGIVFNNNLFTPASYKYYEVNNTPKNGIHLKNFTNGLQNARNILKSLEHSLQKTKKYEKQLLKCKESHSHGVKEWWQDLSGDEQSKCSKIETNSPRSPVDFTKSWSTISIVCLQFQYEELSKRYESLLQTYNDRCTALTNREAALARLRQRVRMTHARLTRTHQTLLTIGEKYLALRDRKITQKLRYEEKLQRLQNTVRGVMAEAERARRDLDAHIADTMTTESDAGTSLLLAEIRKCNLLYLENLRLKAQVEELAPGQVVWNAT